VGTRTPYFRLGVASCALAVIPSAPAQNRVPNTPADIVQRMVQMNRARTNALRGYRSFRRYFAENSSFGLRAEVSVQEIYSFPGKKEFKIVSEAGSPFIRHQVIEKLMDAEIDDSSSEHREQGELSPENYVFRQVGNETIAGRPAYIFEVSPKTSNKYLMRGRVWIDAQDFAVARMEGSTAYSPSFWTRKNHFVRNYEKHGAFWLPASLESDSHILLAGKGVLRIEYSNYEIDSAASLLSNAAVAVETAAKQGGN
jgi:MucB/RseB N-terminal domain